MDHFPLTQSLKKFNTFGLEALCRGILSIENEADVKSIVEQEVHPIKILGGGSNILLTDDIDAFILKNEIKGIDIIYEDSETVLVNVGAGEMWHDFVMWSLSKNLAGIENLSLIPGTVGAAPMQNIGAYGVEQENAFHSLKAIDMKTGYSRTFFKEECDFGYRQSIFKKEYKDRYFITEVNYQLRKTTDKLHLEYGAIKKVLEEKMITSPTIHDVSDAVIEIRRSKLPDPNEIGNAGSFFKNPIIDIELYNSLKEEFTDIPMYPISDSHVKVPAGWLIDRLGYKGYTRDNVGVHKNQALVLVNYGEGLGKDILDLSKEIQQKVKEKYQIDIIPEVNIW